MVLQKINSSSHSKTKSIFGFTLIELIVVITILAILGTIGFLSIGGYSSKARDSARIGDSAQISKSLDLSIVTTGIYPMPDTAFSVTYSGGIVWYQGTIGTTVMQVFKSSISGGGLNEKPVDPLTNKEYTYSKLAEGNAYQIKIDYEGDLNQTTLDTSLVNQATAAPGNPTIAYIRGNYGNLTAKVSTGGILYVLAIPSIITNTGTTTGGSLTTNSLSGTLLFNGRNLRNASEFNPSTLVHSGAKNTSNPSGLPDTSTGILNMMSILKSTYVTSDIQSNQNIANLINTATGNLTTLGTSIINAQLGGSAVSSGGGGGTTDTTVSGTCTGLPSNATYYGSVTSYSLVSATNGTSLTASGVTTPVTNTCQFKCNINYSLMGNLCIAPYIGSASKGGADIKAWWDLQSNGITYIGATLGCPLYKFDKTSSFVFGWTSSCDTSWGSTTNSYYSTNCGSNWTSLIQTGCSYANPIIYNDFVNNGSWYLSINNGGHGGNGCGSTWQTISGGQLCIPNGGGNHTNGYNWYMWK